MYDYSAAVYKTWVDSSPIEKDLAQRIVARWKACLRADLYEAYRAIKHSENRPEFEVFYTQWIASNIKNHESHEGLTTALTSLAKETPRG